MSNLTIDKRLYCVLSALLVLAFTLLALLTFQGRENHRRMQLVLRRYSAEQSIGLGIELSTVEMQGAQRGLMLSYEAKDEASAPQYIALFESSGKNLDQLLTQLGTLADSQEERDILTKVRESAATWRPRFQELAELCRLGDIAKAYELRSQNKVISANMRTAAAQLVALQRSAMAKAEADSQRAEAVSFWIGVTAGLLSLATAAVALWIVRQIISKLRDAIAVLSDGATQIAEGANQVAESSEGLARGNSSQAASIEETTAATEQIHAMARKNSDSARRAHELMGETATVVDEANRSLGEMQVSMDEITEGSNQVGKIIKEIEQIAFQTNILALNAAVESARAGQAGAGFAVVADEVRTLAQRSAQAAEDTSLLIGESISRSRLGHSRLEMVAHAVHGITEGTRQASALVVEMKAGSDEQTKGVQQISRAMSEIEKITQSAAAHAEEGAATGEQMSAQTESMREIVQTLHAMVG